MKYPYLVTIMLLFSLQFLPAQEEAEPVDEDSVASEVSSGEVDPGERDQAEGKQLLQEYFKANGLGQWEHEIDVSSLDKGTYNLVVRGIDSAGNEIEADPVDIQVDPESDLPVSSISFPTRGSVVTGNITILGSAVDDDDVEYVEIKLGSDGEFIRAEGREYWTADLVTDGMEDGEYTIYTRATDINGKTGHERSISFHYNTDNPVITVSSIENGDLVSRKIDINGTIEDLNGVASLTYSLDEGETFAPVSLKGKTREGTGEFSFSIDTRKLELEDGPQIIVLRGYDLRGGEGSAAYLVYIDNSNPVVDFLYPLEEDEVNGTFVVIGRAWDEVGVESLTYNYKGEEPVEIPLHPGNPFWAVTADFLGEKNMELQFTVTDTAGNVEEITYKHALAWEADLPVVELVQPTAEGEMTEKRLQGWVIDDDDPKGIIYSIDRGEEISVETGRSFDLDLSSLTPGTHRLDIRGVDEYEIEGVPVTIEFMVAPEEPVVSDLEFTAGEDGTALPFAPGIEIDSSEYRALRGTITFSGGDGTAEYILPGGDPAELSLRGGEADGEYIFEIPFPDTVPYGYFPLTITARDELGSALEYTVWFWMTNLSVNQLEHGIYLPGESAVLTPGSEYRARYVGYPLTSVELEPALDYVNISEDDGNIILRSTGSGRASSVRIKAVSNRDVEFFSEPITVISDRSSPEIEFDAEPTGVKNGNFTVRGTVSDDTGPVAVTYIVNGPDGPGEAQQVRVSGDGTEGAFSISLSAGTFTEEGGGISVTAEDGAGNRSTLYAGFLPQPEPEPSRKIYPLSPFEDIPVFAEDIAGARILVAAGITGIESAESVTVSLDDGAPVTMQGFPVATARLPVPGPGSHSLDFTAVYGDGKKLTASRRFSVAPEAGEITGLEIAGAFTQGGDFVRQEEAAFTGIITGSNSYDTALFSLDDNEEQTLKLSKEDEGLSFSIPLEKLNYGLHTLDLTLTDGTGRSIEKEYLFYLASGSEGRRITDEEGIYPLHHDDSSYVTGDGLSYIFHGREISGVELENGGDLLELEYSGNIITLVPSGSGIQSGVSFTVTTIDGDSFTQGPFDISTDITAPLLTTDSLNTRRYFSDSIPVSGLLEDDFALDTLEFSLNDGVYRSLELLPGSAAPAAAEDGAEGEGTAEPGAAAEAGDESTEEADAAAAGEFTDDASWNFRTSVPLTGVDDGPLVLRLRTADTSGNTREYEYFLVKDSAAPRLIQVLPEADESVNGAVSLFVRMEDQWTEDYSGTFVLGESTFELSSETEFLEIPADLSVFTELPENRSVSLTDNAGNTAELVPSFSFDAASDLPIVSVQIPAENAVIQELTTVSGTVSDDDGIAKVEYRIDDGEFIELPAGSSFEFAIDIDTLTDNEHTATVRAFDINGVESEHAILNFRVSKALPVAHLDKPELGTTNKGVVLLQGSASDKNTIKEIFISIDNGNTFQKARGQEEWTYELDSQVLTDGNYMILIRAVDGYGISALYSSLLTLDNSAPKIQLALPMDGDSFTNEVPVQLRVTDDLVVTGVQYRVEALDVELPEDAEPVILEGNFNRENEVILESLDIRELHPGRYSISIFAYDDAENEVVVTRNIVKKVPDLRSVPKLLFPLTGSSVSGPFYVEGRVEGDSIPGTVTIRMDGTDFDVVEVSESGYFYREILPEEVEDGFHEFQAVIREPGDEELPGAVHDIQYSKTGPWVQFNTIHLGSYVRARPWIHGKAGYIPGGDIVWDDLSKKERRSYELEEMEYSLDNGQTFEELKAKEEWKFRLETQELTEGDLAVIVRARFADGKTAQARTLVIVDDTTPNITLVTPEEGKAFNDIVAVSGTAFDENGISDISVMIRKGSKNSYGVPQFIQGLYFDAHFMGTTYYEVGVGLTFFDDNVKLQALFGQAPPGRFNGMVFGVKLLANVATIPYGYFFGPDWEFLSSSVAVGSVFQYYTMTESIRENNEEEEDGVVLGAIVAQLELVKVTLPNVKMFNTFSLYQESQLWFISSDIQAGLSLRFSVGVRVSVF